MTFPAISRALENICAISPYQPGKPISELAREMGLQEDEIIKLASNENPLGMSPKAKAALTAEIDTLNLYPDGNGFALKQAIVRHTGIGMDGIVLGNGSNDLLDLVARVYLASGRSAVFSQYAFAVYPIAILSAGGRCIEVPAKDFGHDLPAMRAAITTDTRLVFIANPNNPTGTFLPATEVQAFLKTVPTDVIVVLDEAYNEYLPPEQRGNSAAWLREFPNLVITRTFSKIYGLAGLRVGYALASPPVADLMNRVRQPFNVGSLALAAATAALDDREFLDRSYECNRQGLEQVAAGVKRLGFEMIPSSGNFLTFRVGKEAAEVNRRLLQMGVIVRPLASYRMAEWLRVTIGTQAENERFLVALEKSAKACSLCELLQE